MAQGNEMAPTPSHAEPRLRPQLSDRFLAPQSSAIRDLLNQAKRPGMISLAGGLPDAASFPNEQLAAVAADLLASSASLQYGTTQGEPAVRAVLATLFNGALADDVVVTSGSQQALDLISRVVVNPGDSVVLGDPEYLGALQLFRSYGADLHAIAVDSDGMNTEQLEHQLLGGLRPKCCYIVPNFHNPTGCSMSAKRRAHLGRLAQHYGFLIIEDDPYRELFCELVPSDEIPFPPELTVQLRSISKTLAPGLRIGAAAAPRWLLEPMIIAKQSSDLHTSTFSQALVAQALAAPWYDGHLNAVRSMYRGKRDALVQALTQRFEDRIEFETPSGGMFVWARFHEIPDTTRWLTQALNRGVCFVPGQAFSVQKDLSQFARFSYATATPTELAEGVGRLPVSNVEVVPGDDYPRLAG